MLYAELGKKYDPRLKIRVPDYATGDNATEVDKISRREVVAATGAD